MESGIIKIINNEEKKYYVNFDIMTDSEDYIIKYKEENKIKEEYKNKKINISCILKKNEEIMIINRDKNERIRIINIEKKGIEKEEKIKINKIYIINLEYREDRKRKMEEQLRRYKIENYEFIKAVDKRERRIIEEYEELRKNKKTRIKTVGHYACLMSHIKVI